jgi:ribosome maturation factor RimP
MIGRRERTRSLLLLMYLTGKEITMTSDNQVVTIESKIDQLLAEMPGYFLVEVSIKPTNNIKVYVDADQGAAIDQLSKINRALYKWIEENLFPNGDFSIEVSSPGLDEPLKLERQYLKNIGRFVEVLLKNGIKKEGRLLNVSENEIVVEEEKGQGKKKELVQHLILKADIKSTKIQIRI